jgi:Glycosyl hydrolases family 43
MDSGGSSVAGASASLGGTVSSGGTFSTGGTSGTGGSIATGGNGGSAAIGGASGTGGTIATGGATVTGGASATGGTTATGGTQIVTGGTTGTGGIARTGGTAAAGGNGSGGVATGGTSTSGGTSSTGGMAAGGTTATGGTMPTGATASIISAVPWLDTSGNLVNAHGVGFIKVGNTYYMVGEQRSGLNDTYSGSMANGEDAFSGISMYSTTDFVNWTFVGTVVKPVPGTILYPPQCGERPKILYNASTSKYVIYIKMMTQTGSPSVYIGSFAVLTSSSISGPYTLQGTLSLTGADDFQVFQDTDGSQYLVRSEGKLYKLSADALSIASTVKTGIQSGEGVSLYQAGSTYFWQSSQGSYWHCNDNSYSTATSLTGTWTSHGNFCPSGSKTWESQDTAVVTVAGTAGTTYIYVGDRWVNGHLPASTLVMQPLTVNGSTESIPTYNPTWNLDVAAGTWSAVTPSGTSVNDNTTGTGPNQFTYSSGWTASSCSSCYNSDSHSSSTTDATASIAFTGTRILLYSAYDTSSGIMGVTLSDSGGTAVTPEVQVSLRSDAPATGNYLVYASPVLPNGSYVLKVRVTGLKDLYSSGTTCNIDRVLIQ